MNTSEIEALLEKFYDGNTTLREENTLREFFMRKDVPGHLKIHQPLFAFFEEEGQMEIDNRDFELELTSKITSQLAETETMPVYAARQRFLYFSGIAASFLILAGLLFVFQRDLFHQAALQRNNLDTEIAYANASEALLMVSGNLNHGLKQASHLQMVDKAMKNIELFTKFYQYQTIIINPDELSNRSTKTK